MVVHYVLIKNIWKNIVTTKKKQKTNGLVIQPPSKGCYPPKVNMSPEKGPFLKGHFIVQPSIFRGYSLVFREVTQKVDILRDTSGDDVSHGIFPSHRDMFVKKGHFQHIKKTLVFQNPPVIPCEDRCLDPLKAFHLRRCERGSKHRSSQGMTGRLGKCHPARGEGNDPVIPGDMAIQG